MFFIEEPLHKLWAVLEYILLPKRVKWFKIVFTVCLIYWCGFTALSIKYTSNRCVHERAVYIIPLFFMQPVSIS